MCGDEEEEVLEGLESSQPEASPNSEPVTETANGSRNREYRTDLAALKALQGIGFRNTKATIIIQAIGPEATHKLCGTVQSRKATNPAGLATAILKREYPMEWQTIQASRGLDHPLVALKGSGGCSCRGRGICEACMPSRELDAAQAG